VKGAGIGAALGLPLAAVVMWLMRADRPVVVAWAWAVWIGFQFLLLALYPTVIAPLFNKFSPLPPGAARAAIEALLARCDFANRGLFVMDGSRRSSHGNAFFTGFGRAKRIVFFDTLLERLTPDEVEAVLAHELGHFKLKHVLKRMLWTALASLAFLGLLAWLAASPWFYEGLGVPPAMDRPGVALILFFLALPVFTFVLAPAVRRCTRAGTNSRRTGSPRNTRRPRRSSARWSSSTRTTPPRSRRIRVFGIPRFAPAGRRAHRTARSRVIRTARIEAGTA
jgi:STE24 endopeptidase